MKQVMNYHKDNGLLNMIRRTDPSSCRIPSWNYKENSVNKEIFTR